MYQVEQMEVGRLQENTYLLINEQKEALIIDPVSYTHLTLPTM